MSTAVYILNRLPTKSVQDMTLYEAWHGEKPTVHYLRIFGCIAHAKITRPHAGKLDDRSVKTVFVGYEPGSKAYRVYDPVRKRLHITRDVVFDEAASWNWAEIGSDAAAPGTFTVEYMVDVLSGGGEPGAPVSPAPTADTSIPGHGGAQNTGGSCRQPEQRGRRVLFTTDEHPVWQRPGRRGRATPVPHGGRLHQLSCT